MTPSDVIGWAFAGLAVLQACDGASALLRTQHALIAQFHHASEGEHFEHDDQRAALAAATQYLTQGPKT